MSYRFEVRERTEEIERASLSTWATLVSETKGRDRYEDPDPLRTAFQQDRERLWGTDAFARLGAKTHSFVPGADATGWRPQLSHTVATVSLARAMARALRLNEDLAEAIAIGHRLGAPPYGPAGIEALSEVLGHPFEVAEQTLRLVERPEAQLNLTWEVRDGILHQGLERPASTLEGKVAALARSLAEALFDLRAALRAGVTHLDDVPPAVRTVLGTDHEGRVEVVVADAVAVSADRPEVGSGAEVEEARQALEAFLDAEVRGREEARAEHDRALHCLRSLAIFAETHRAGDEDRVDGIVDWLAAATDREVSEAFAATFTPGGTAGQ